jgi:pyruvate dehydrogenase E1 component beta subunit
MALGTAEYMATQGINVEVLDLRSIKPLDFDLVLNSVSKTHRCVVAEQNRPFCGIGAEIAFQIQRELFDSLDAPILRVTQEEVPMPYNEKLESAVLPSEEKILQAVTQVCYL